MGIEMRSHPDPKMRKLYREFVKLSFQRCLRQLFGGVANNWRERRFFKHTNSLNRLLLQPTHVSFCGFFNIQRYGKPADLEDSEAIYHAFYRVAGQDLILDGHHWVNASNFHLATDGPKLLDYGSLVTQNVIDTWGVSLYTGFNLKVGRAQAEKYRRVFEERMKEPI